jgi:hypothetical protein
LYWKAFGVLHLEALFQHGIVQFDQKQVLSYRGTNSHVQIHLVILNIHIQTLKT